MILDRASNHMKIIFVIENLMNGGAERECVIYANTLVNKGEEVHIVCIRDADADYRVDERVHIHRMCPPSEVRIPKVRGLCNVLRLIADLRKLSGDVMIPMYLPADYYVWSRIAALFSRTKWVYTVRNNQKKDSLSARSRRLRHSTSYFADGIWIQTEGQRAFFPRYMQRKIFEVPNILDDRFLRISREEKERIRSFIGVGRIHPQKNHKMLVQAFARMIERTGNQEATLVIYGRPHPRFQKTEDELKAMIAQYQLGNRVFLLGRAVDIDAKYAAADAFVLSSDYEGLPNVLMEAMAAGLPCISTDCQTGPSALIESGKNGLLVPVGDVEAMSRAMEYLIENPRAANDLGKAAKQRMKDWESSEVLAERLLLWLKRICDV